MDRPLGSEHLNHGFDYSVNNGYLPGTELADGDRWFHRGCGFHEEIEGSVTYQEQWLEHRTLRGLTVSCKRDG